MRRAILTAAALALMTTAASAGGLYCNRYGGTLSCSFAIGATPNPYVRSVPADESEAARAEVTKWEEFCKPVRERDALGVVRLRYAHPGCEFGRSE